MILDATNPRRSGVAANGCSTRRWDDPPTAGSLWDEALGSDWPARACGLGLLDGLDSDEPATVTPIVAGLRRLGGYQRATVARVEVGGRTLYRALHGYAEGYVSAFAATTEQAEEMLAPEPLAPVGAAE